MHFLLLYDRSAGRLLQPTAAFEHRGDAMRARFEAEELHAGDTNVEAVVFDAPSIDALRRTHARYFMSLGELAHHARDGATEAPRAAPAPHRYQLPTHTAS